MDNNTPTTDDPNKPQDTQEQMPENLDDIELLEPEQESLGGSKKKLFIIAGVLLVGVSYTLYSIFYVPEEPKNLDPTKITGSAKVTPQSGDEVPNVDMVAEPAALPSPPQVTLQAPPPPIESPVYTPPPIVAPPPVTLGGAGTPVTGAPGAPPVLSPTGSKNVVDEPPPPPPPPPAVAALKNSKSRGGAGDEGADKRLRANMIIMDGGGPGSDKPKLQASGTGRDANSRFANDAKNVPPTEKVTATIVTNLGMTILQGKIINAVLETAINTDLPGTLRAIVARDTYAESGRDILIPKGSRLIGTYNTEVKQGQTRVMIVWSRLIRPDGVDIQIGSDAVDGLGRAGVMGNVDNKFAEIFTASILTSAITLGASVAADAVLPRQKNTTSTTTTTPEGNQITNATPAQQSAAQAVNDLGSTGKDVVDKMVNVAPTITVDQGTLINVFVNKDLTFPDNTNNSEFFIQ